MKTKKYITLVVALATVGSLALAASAFAQNAPGQGGGIMYQGRRQPAIFGTVSSVNGNVITVNGSTGQVAGTKTTYTVDATNTVVTKNGAASSVANILVGDTVTVEGSVNGTNVAAKTIRDGVRTMMGGQKGLNGMAVVGTVSAVSGNSITISGRTWAGRGEDSGTGTTYTVDASGATVTKNNSASTVSAITVGDTIAVQGTISGTNVTAKSIKDGV